MDGTIFSWRFIFFAAWHTSAFAPMSLSSSGICYLSPTLSILVQSYFAKGAECSYERLALLAFMTLYEGLAPTPKIITSSLYYLR
ncbi:hypothetical protein K2173_021358 [Erythroxylum novogranatense]|uniref:Secreted protein n=1 Tax=Erythroxylum novogranatense TaxID=1862640 RepID=A0AAV8TUS8_9ROSI|nr:hypothetical protein K2173_021358 [Erythroxylum novogranatense]